MTAKNAKNAATLTTVENSVDLLALAIAATEEAKAAKVAATPVAPVAAPVADGWKVLPAGVERLVRTSLKWAKGLKGCTRPHAISEDGGETWNYVREIELTGPVSLITLKTHCMNGRTTAMKTTGEIRVK